MNFRKADSSLAFMFSTSSLILCIEIVLTVKGILASTEFIWKYLRSQKNTLNQNRSICKSSFESKPDHFFEVKSEKGYEVSVDVFLL
jgi:hypothetical protein